MRWIFKVGFLLLPLSILSCSKPSKEQIVTAVLEDPAIMVAAFKKDSNALTRNFVDAADQKRFQKTLEPSLSADQVYRGPENAKIVIVEYTDFECPYCSKASVLLNDVLKKYDGKVKVTYKHYPLSMHQHSRLAARYFEGIRIQDPKVALKFHDAVFAQQSELQSKGNDFLLAEATKLGVDIPKLKVDLISEAVTAKITADTKEAEKFGFEGTPAFVIDGVAVPGYLKPEKFDRLVEGVLENRNGKG